VFEFLFTASEAAQLINDALKSDQLKEVGWHNYELQQPKKSSVEECTN
jgi:hypothetical protein